MEQKNVKIKGDYSIVVTARSPLLPEHCEHVEKVNESIVFSEDLVLEQAVPMALSLKNVLPPMSYVHVVHKDDIKCFETAYVSKFMF